MFKWNYVGGLMEAFKHHSYPVSQDDDRWIVQWEDSAEQQGPIWDSYGTKGTYHPNEEGHQAISRAIVNAIVPDLAHRPDDNAPKIVGSTLFVFQQNSALGYQSLEVAFDTPINPTTFTPADVRIATTSGMTAKVRAANVFPEHQRFQIVFEPAAMASQVPGEYLLTIGPDVRSTFGIPMDQNSDGRLARRIGSHELDQYSKKFTTVSPIRLVDGIVTIEGSSQADVVRVTLAAANWLVTFATADVRRGGFGNDQLYGNDGIDKLFGDAGDDIIEGGLGTDDHWIGGSGRDTFIDWYYPLPKSTQNNRANSQRVRKDIVLDYVFGEDVLRLFYR